MTNVQFIEPQGAERLLVIPKSEYVRLCEAAEALEDIALLDEAKARIAEGRSHYVDSEGSPVSVGVGGS